MPEPLPVALTPDGVELAEMDPPATAEEAAWAKREAYHVDPGTDSPAAKLLQRRRSEAQAAAKVEADARAESPLAKFGRVWA